MGHISPKGNHQNCLLDACSFASFFFCNHWRGWLSLTTALSKKYPAHLFTSLHPPSLYLDLIAFLWTWPLPSLPAGWRHCCSLTCEIEGFSSVGSSRQTSDGCNLESGDLRGSGGSSSNEVVDSRNRGGDLGGDPVHLRQKGLQCRNSY